LTGHRRRIRAAVAIAVLAAACRAETEPGDKTRSTTAPQRGGRITASIRTEPRSFNRLTQRDSSTDLVSNLTQAKLVRINRATQEVEPWLAEGWSRSDDGLMYTVRLRGDIAFSDGHPFTADDVVFSFRAVYDERTASSLADSLEAGGRRLQVTAADPRTVIIRFPAPFAPGLRLLDNLPILPKHKLEAALNAGKLATAWNLATPPSEIVGLGPFVLTEYLPGQRLVFNRNPRYFRRSAEGVQLPYLDGLTIEIVPDQNAELLRLEAGQIDTMTSEIAPEAYGALKRAADAGRVRLLDLGVAYVADSFWVNLKPGSFGDDPRASWLQSDELRRAISMAVDRRLFADTVFLGAGAAEYGPITESNKKWYWSGVPKTPYDPDGARKLLATIGLVDRTGTGVLTDARGEPGRFTLLTQKGRPALERGSAVIRDGLRKIGLAVDVVPLDANALIPRIMTAKYEAVYFNADVTDTDPAISPDFWFSFGDAHLWNIGQKSPATDWERRIDDLMRRQIASADETERKRLFDEVQMIFAEHVPVVYFVAPRVYVGVASRVANLTPAISKPQLLWAADTIAVMH
jgi:peptide/nickel transport system substrate-binding protein